MTDKLNTGDLVIAVGIPHLEGQACVIIKGPYPTVYTFEKDGIVCSEETLAVDLMCSGRIYPKVKASFLFRIYSEHLKQ